MRAILFDLDGTLIDSAPDLRLAINKVLTDYDRPPLDPPTIVSMIGDGARKLVERAFVETGGLPEGTDRESLAREFLAHYHGHETDASKPFEGATETLESLSAEGFKLAVCTNKPQSPAEAMLRNFRMRDYFGAVIGGDRLPGVRKPDARHLLAGIEALGETPRTAVMVGDGDNDLLAARNAGIPVVIVSFGYSKRPPREMGADAVIDHFRDLKATLAAFA